MLLPSLPNLLAIIALLSPGPSRLRNIFPNHKRIGSFLSPPLRIRFSPLRGAVALVEKAGTIATEAGEKSGPLFLIFQMWTHRAMSVVHLGHCLGKLFRGRSCAAEVLALLLP